MFNHKKFIAFLMSAATVACLLTGCGDTGRAAIDTQDGITNILDYVTVSFDGKSGAGTAFVSVDYDGLEIKELDEIEDLSELTKYINAVSSISLSIDRNKDLSNGDQVVVSVTYDESAAQAAGVNFGDQKSKTFEVKGLKK